MTARVWLQWATRAPGDWDRQQFSSNEQIEALVARVGKGVPREVGRVLDQQPGWLLAWNVQGTTAEGWDHVAFSIRDTDGFLLIDCWNDDPVDWPAGTRSAQSFFFGPLAPDPKLGGRTNTQSGSVFFADPGYYPDDRLPDGVRPYAEFVVPPPERTLHGVWTSDTLFEGHRSARAHTTWDGGDWD